MWHVLGRKTYDNKLLNTLYVPSRAAPYVPSLGVARVDCSSRVEYNSQKRVDYNSRVAYKSPSTQNEVCAIELKLESATELHIEALLANVLKPCMYVCTAAH